MNFLLSGSLSFLLVYKYPALFLVVIASAIAVPFPIDTMLIAVGAFASQGYFSPIVSFFAAFLGNVLGDVLSYVIWKQYGRSIIREKYAKKYAFFSRIEGYTQRYAGPTVFASRFVGVLGPIVNFLCGYGRVRFEIFLLGSVSGNAVDTAWPIMLGYIVGSSWENFSGLATIIGAIITLVAIIGALMRVYFESR
jgi:membrane protein DedA with SNARE-associated domain